ncbi:hypothetical protein DXT99_19005 [Pontibacter diazotrophicus]|uniref:Uncharacterized protein n=1 Tax=Pontibacter diazotrophicus TaxID=1400979 RepID=A0A3D8L8C5_9BACT|nr:hypothetical protein [Pontibacter diazotrophicus]RDV13624.1 hypothetical protein DXT99_19005 [Pontibacter diazotrophicus]
MTAVISAACTVALEQWYMRQFFGHTWFPEAVDKVIHTQRATPDKAVVWRSVYYPDIKSGRPYVLLLDTSVALLIFALM